MYTDDCVAMSDSTSIIKFADDTVVLAPISGNIEKANLEEIKKLENWCQENNRILNVSKTMELIVDFSTKHVRSYQPLHISGTPVERVDSSLKANSERMRRSFFPQAIRVLNQDTI